MDPVELHVWKAGDPVRITYGDRTVNGCIVLASTNGRSLMLAFQAMLGGYVGMMPVLWSEEASSFECLVERRRVVLAEPAASTPEGEAEPR